MDLECAGVKLDVVRFLFWTSVSILHCFPICLDFGFALSFRVLCFCMAICIQFSILVWYCYVRFGGELMFANRYYKLFACR